MVCHNGGGFPLSKPGRTMRTAKDMRSWFWMMLTVAVLALGTAILPRGLEAARLLGGPRDDAAVADYILSGRTAAHYEAAAAQALAGKDDDLAASLRELAAARGVALSPAILQDIGSGAPGSA